MFRNHFGSTWGPYGMSGIEPGLAACKTNTLQLYYSSMSCFLNFITMNHMASKSLLVEFQVSGFQHPSLNSCPHFPLLPFHLALY